MNLHRKKTLPALDIVRFVAAMVVMLYHLFFWRNGQVANSQEGFNAVWWFGWVGVEVFFALSGYVIALSAQHASPTQFAISRAVRLAPSVWICATFTFLAICLDGGATLQTLVSYLYTLFVRPLGNHIDGVYWTLTVEIAFYFFVYACLRLAGFGAALKAIIVMGLLSCVFNVLMLITPALQEAAPAWHATFTKVGNMLTVRLLLLKHGCLFALGVMIWRIQAQRAPRYAWVLTGLFAAGSTIEVWCSTQAHELQYLKALRDLHIDAQAMVELESPWRYAQAVLAWLIGLAAIAISGMPRVTAALSAWTPSLRKLGLMTFPVYLLHNKIGLVIQGALFSQGMPPWAATSGAAVVVLLLSAWVTFRLEPPLSRLLKGALERLAQGKRVLGQAA